MTLISLFPTLPVDFQLSNHKWIPFLAILSVTRHLCFALVAAPVQTIALTPPPLGPSFAWVRLNNCQKWYLWLLSWKSIQLRFIAFAFLLANNLLLITEFVECIRRELANVPRQCSNGLRTETQKNISERLKLYFRCSKNFRVGSQNLGMFG